MSDLSLWRCIVFTGFLVATMVTGNAGFMFLAIMFLIMPGLGLMKRPEKNKEGGNMQAYVDQQICKGHGLCVEICPEIFEMQEDKANTKVTVVPEELEGRCREAAESCPTQAICFEE